jgi:hypothetical protein
MSTPRGHLRPDRVGRERPPSERARDRLPGVAAGVARPTSLSSRIRAASEAAKTAALIIGTGRYEPLFYNDLSPKVVGREVRGVLRQRVCRARRRGEHCSRICVPPLRHTVEQDVDAHSHVLLGTQEVRPLLHRTWRSTTLGTPSAVGLVTAAERRNAQRMDAWKPFPSNSILTSLESLNDLFQPLWPSPNECA